MIENHWANSLAEDNLVELWWTCGGELLYKMLQEQSVVKLCRIVRNCAECCGIVRLGGGLHRKPTPDQRSLNERWSRRTWCVMMMIMMMVMFKMGMKHESKRLSARWVTLFLMFSWLWCLCLRCHHHSPLHWHYRCHPNVHHIEQEARMQ